MRVTVAASRHMALQAAVMSISPIERISLTGIPVPPSVNALFANVPGKGRVKSERYATWKNAAGWIVKPQLRGARIHGPVKLSFAICEDETRADLGNLEKALTDLLVDLCVIDGDNQAVVREINLVWTTVAGASVVIEALA